MLYLLDSGSKVQHFATLVTRRHGIDICTMLPAVDKSAKIKHHAMRSRQKIQNFTPSYRQHIKDANNNTMLSSVDSAFKNLDHIIF